MSENEEGRDQIGVRVLCVVCVSAHTEEVIKCVPTVKKQGEPCGLCKIQLLLKVPVRQQHTQHTTR